MTTLAEKIGQRAHNMDAMMRQLGVAPEAVYGAGRGESAARRCLHCGQVDACSRWLTAPGAAPTAWQTFCPNAGLFEQLRSDRG